MDLTVDINEHSLYVQILSSQRQVLTLPDFCEHVNLLIQPLFSFSERLYHALFSDEARVELLAKVVDEVELEAD